MQIKVQVKLLRKSNKYLKTFFSENIHTKNLVTIFNDVLKQY